MCPHNVENDFGFGLKRNLQIYVPYYVTYAWSSSYSVL